MINIIKQKIHNLISDQKFSEIFTGSIWALSARVLSTGFGLVASIIIAWLYGGDVVGILAVILLQACVLGVKPPAMSYELYNLPKRL